MRYWLIPTIDKKWICGFHKKSFLVVWNIYNWSKKIFWKVKIFELLLRVKVMQMFFFFNSVIYIANNNHESLKQYILIVERFSNSHLISLNFYKISTVPISCNIFFYLCSGTEKGLEINYMEWQLFLNTHDKYRTFIAEKKSHFIFILWKHH